MADILIFCLTFSLSRNILKKDYFPNPFSGRNHDGDHSQGHGSARMDVFCCPVSSKSEARLLESRLISELKKHGFHVRNDADERHQRFGSVG